MSQGEVPTFVAIVEEDGRRVLVTNGPAWGLNVCDVSCSVVLAPQRASRSEEATQV